MDQVLAGRYQVLRVLGRGGMGITYLCSDLLLPSKRTFVVKEMWHDGSKPGLFAWLVERFRREAEVLESLGEDSNGRIPRLYAYFEQSGRYYLVQEFVDGETLLARLTREGPMPQATVLAIYDELLATLEFVHSRKIIHRDIKPDNVMVRSNDKRVVLIDFGVIKEVLNESNSTVMAGTPGYMAPEQQQGYPTYASDLYALAVVCLQLLSGMTPKALYDPGTFSFRVDSLSGHVSRELLDVLRRATSYYPPNRFESATEVREAIRHLLAEGEGVSFEQARPGHGTNILGSQPLADGKDAESDRAAAEDSEIETIERKPREASPRAPRSTDGDPSVDRGEEERSQPRSVEPANLNAEMPDPPSDSDPPGGRTRRIVPDAKVRGMRIYDLAIETGLSNRQMLDLARAFGAEVWVPSNNVPGDLANRVREYLIEGTHVEIGAGQSVSMILVKPGSFLMGPDDEDEQERSAHHVTIRSGFYLGKCPVTQGQWTSLMGSNPSYFKGDAGLPVECVSWDDVQRFLTKLNARMGGGWRLPTEAEWEYACRAGTTGDYAGELSEMAWFDENSGDETHLVGTKRPNAWGLYDMHGNVWEWCSDWHAVYGSGERVDPVGAPAGSFRVYRGGCFFFSAINCRSAHRASGSPGVRSPYLGFRLARTIGTSERTGLSVSRSTSTAQVPNRSQISVEGTPVADGGTPADQRTASLDVGAAKPSRASVNVSRIQMADMVLIQPGTFLMGSENGMEDDEKPVHEVVISKPYYLGKCQVTQGQWTSLMGSNPSEFKGDAGLPVECVSWDDVQRFLTKLNARMGGGWRLPTEAEWEYACRAGTTGDYAGELSEMAWYGDNAGGKQLDVGSLFATGEDACISHMIANGNRPRAVGIMSPNTWGLYDMHGNVWEWCSDWFSPYEIAEKGDDAAMGFDRLFAKLDRLTAGLKGEFVLNPTGAPTGSKRVVRGGAVFDSAYFCRSSIRAAESPDEGCPMIGFRLARTAQ